jgi:Pyridoxamine 5'-phosphate oxidase
MDNQTMFSSDGPRRLSELSRGKSLRLLASVRLGRVVFTSRALPAIRLVRHVMDGDDIIISCGPEGTAIVRDGAPEPGVVVAYEADAFDTDARLGWSVIVTGMARRVSDPGDIARYEQLLQPRAVDHGDHIIRISPELVTGYLLDPVTSLEPCRVTGNG